MKWSLSSHRAFRTCQRRYFFKYIAAHHAAKRDPIRREAFLLSQGKHLSTWQGLVVHQAIKEFLVPYLQRNASIDWNTVLESALRMARSQFNFSQQRRLREPGMTKAKFPRDYCSLMPHDQGGIIPSKQAEGVLQTIQVCVENLARMEGLLNYIQHRRFYLAETPISVKYDGARVQVVPDLLFTRGYGQISIVDWKVEQDHSRGDHELQTSLYAWVLYNSDKWHIRSPEDIELIEVQLLQKTTRHHKCSAERFQELGDRIFKSIHEIRALCHSHKYQNQNLLDYEFANNHNTCTYCAFNPLCKELANGTPVKSFWDN